MSTADDYKACILAAGRGTRMEALAKGTHKALLPIGGKAILSHIVESFPEEVELVLAVGYKKELIAGHLEENYPERKTTLVEVDNFDGPGSGPGYSMLKCKSHLQCPFILDAADTLVEERIPPPDHDWLGVSGIEPSETAGYCTARVEGGMVVKLEDKVLNSNRYAYIGLSGINSYGVFWESLQKRDFLVENEYQVVNGLLGIVEKARPRAAEFTWYDTGTGKNYLRAAEKFGK